MRVLPLSGCYSRVPTNSPWKMKILTERSKQQTINFFFSSHQSRPSSSHCNSPDTETAAALPADPAVLQWDCTCSVLYRPAVSRHRDRGALGRQHLSHSSNWAGWTEWLLSWYEPPVSSPLITGIVPTTVALKFRPLEDKYLHHHGFITIYSVYLSTLLISWSCFISVIWSSELRGGVISSTSAGIGVDWHW